MQSRLNLVSTPNPFHTHDCDRCVYKGSMVEVSEDFGARVLDVYVCSDHREIIVRHGSDGPEYVASPLRMLCEYPPHALQVRAAHMVSAPLE